MTVDLCEPITFGFTKGMQDGCAVDVPVSLEPALTTLDDGTGAGDCKHICADIVFDRATGTDRIVFDAQGLQCVSGIGPLTEITTILPTWSTRGTAKGCDVSPTRGVLRGTIVTFTTASGCSPVRAVECFQKDPLLMRPEYWVPAACFLYGGLDCVYCGSKWDLACTIEPEAHDDTPLCTSYADYFGSLAARVPILLPGAYIIPNSKNWDITGDDQPFHAGDGLDGLVRYYLKDFHGGVDPRVNPYLPYYTDWCCTWLCNWTHTAALGHAWRLFCNEPTQHAPGETVDQVAPKYVGLNWLPGKYSLVHFNFPTMKPCFPLADQFCMTDGGGSDVWSHLSMGDTKLAALDTLNVDLDCRIAEDADGNLHDEYPHTDAEYLRIVNDALWEADRYGLQVSHPERHAWYDSHALNYWGLDEGFGGVVAPAVHRRSDPGGDPRTVYVTPYGTDYRLPADLILSRLTIQLRISFESRNTHGDTGDPVAAGVRLPATLDLHLWLKARLRPGWENITSSVTFPYADADPCNLMTEPYRPVVVSADDCSAVPLKIHWRGVNGPRPWSRSEFGHESFPSNPIPCCDFLCALSGLLIPGEVRATSAPMGPQPYEGDVVVTMVTSPTEYGCDCG